MNYKVLAMNFGSTSTKVAIYEGDKEVMIQTFRHTNEEMANIHNMEENAAFRKGVIKIGRASCRERVFRPV